MKRIITVSSLLLVCLASLASSDSVNEVWVSRYNGPYSHIDEASALIVDVSGNVYVTGSSYASNDIYYDIATLKYDSDGIEMWVRRLNGSGNGIDGGNDIALGSGGKVYVTGYVSGSVADDCCTICYDDDGDTEWVEYYDGSCAGSDRGFGIVVGPDGYIYVAAESDGQETGPDIVLLKYDPAGGLVWETRYNAPYNSWDSPEDIEVDQDGFIYITGFIFTGTYNSDYITLKFDPSGELLWDASYDGPPRGFDSAHALAVDGEGNVFVTGGSNGDSTGCDIVTICYGPDGTEQWTERYNGPASEIDVGQDVAVDQAGNVYVTGGTSVNDNRDIVTVKYSSSGVEQWMITYNGPGLTWDEGLSITVDQESDVYITGYSYGLNTSADYITIKYSSFGDELWMIRYDDPGRSNDKACDIFVDEAYDIYVTGTSRTNGYGTEDFTTIKYSQEMVGISSHHPLELNTASIHVSPNPSTGQTSVSCELSTPTQVCLDVFDLSGRLRMTEVKDLQTAGTADFSLALSDPGLYFLRLTAGSESVTGRLVILK